MGRQKCIFRVKINLIERPCVNSVDPDQTMHGSYRNVFFGVKINMIDRPCVNSVDPDQTMNVSTEMYFLE